MNGVRMSSSAATCDRPADLGFSTTVAAHRGLLRMRTSALRSLTVSLVTAAAGIRQGNSLVQSRNTHCLPPSNL
jgi:hypothetical protein